MEYLLIENAITQALQICMKLESERGLIAGEGEVQLLNAYIKVFRLLFFFPGVGVGVGASPNGTLNAPSASA